MDPLSMNFQQMGQMGMALQGQAFVGGVSDTGAAPDSSNGSAMLINMMAPSAHQMQMYQTNFTGSSLAQYQAMNQQFSQGKKSNKMNISKNNMAAMRFNAGNFDPVNQFNIAHHNMPMSSNAVLHQENWENS